MSEEQTFEEFLESEEGGPRSGSRARAWVASRKATEARFAGLSDELDAAKAALERIASAAGITNAETPDHLAGEVIELLGRWKSVAEKRKVRLQEWELEA